LIRAWFQGVRARRTFCAALLEQKEPAVDDFAQILGGLGDAARAIGAELASIWVLLQLALLVLAAAAAATIAALVLLALWDAFKREGIEIPSPIQDVRLTDSASAAAGPADRSIVPRDQPA
jgi:hypothetical protein